MVVRIAEAVVIAELSFALRGCVTARDARRRDGYESRSRIVIACVAERWLPRQAPGSANCGRAARNAVGPRPQFADTAGYRSATIAML